MSMLMLASCTRNDAQREFEKEAYSFPANFTETTNQGVVQNLDEDDWRTSPLFQGLIEIVPPYPNPVLTSQNIQFEVNVTGINSVTGIQVWTELPNGRQQIIYEDFETLQPGLTTFQIDPILLSWDSNNSPEGARGLNRVYIFNANQQMISYGDIMVE
ncbi:hypothetical protein [Gracilimonas sp.]